MLRKGLYKMIYRRFRKCYCMNNNQNSQDCSNNIEKSCNNISNSCCETNFNENCNCGFDDDNEMDVFPSDPMLAQSYVPVQYMDKIFMPCVGLDHGTIFPELVSPYNPGDSMRQIEFLRNTNKIREGCNIDGR